MAVPKRKMSRSNTRHRRAQWKATTPTLVPVTVDGVRHLVRSGWRRRTSAGCCVPRTDRRGNAEVSRALTLM